MSVAVPPSLFISHAFQTWPGSEATTWDSEKVTSVGEKSGTSSDALLVNVCLICKPQEGSAFSPTQVFSWQHIWSTEASHKEDLSRHALFL